MPYIETSFGGDPRQSWRHAEHVFRTIARTTFCLKENLGRHVAPETVRVADEPDYVDEAEQGLAGFARESLRNGSFVQVGPPRLFLPLAFHWPPTAFHCPPWPSVDLPLAFI